MRTGRAVVGLGLLVSLALLSPGLSVGRLAASAAIDPRALADTEGSARASVIVYLREQADVRSAHGMRDRSERGQYVYRTLSAHAALTQAPLLRWLVARGVPYQSYWVANMLVVEADRALLDELAARADVARIDSNRPVRGIEDPLIASGTDSADLATGIESGVNNVRAPSVWTLGHTGQGIVIGNSDTGVRWTHAALSSSYRGRDGATANHNYNWHDAVHSGGGVCGANTTAPCDDDGHGTHTMGTLVGDDGGTNRIGVAPGAQWIACRSMNQGVGTPATYSECFQFFIAPTDLAGNNPNPDLRPDVINNSWACPANEGCTTGAELETIVNNVQAAGIFVVASAGNSGPACSTIQYAPAIYAAAFTVGAINAGTNTLASFSSRGPSDYYSPALLKPEVSAPGVNVRSATRSGDTAYATLSGTSMAAPHVAGTVALLWSARPELVGDIASTRAVLQASANGAVTVDPPQQCGGRNSWNVPNNSFGYGRIDALAAVGQAVPTPTPIPTPTPLPTPTPTKKPGPHDTPPPTGSATPAPTASPAPTVPGAPTGATAVAGDSSAAVSWAAPSSNGGSPITGYLVTASSGNRSCSTTGALSCTVTGLSNGTPYTFTVQARNVVGYGPASAPSNSVTPRAVDTTAPSAAMPVARLIAPQTIGSGAVVRISWAAATDASGIARYELQRSTNGGAWSTVSLPSPTALSVDLTLTIGYTYRFTLRATDNAGNTGGWTTTATATLGRAQETNSAITYTSSWTRVALTGASGGYVKKSSTSGNRATYTFSGTSAAVVSARGPSRGIAEIWVDGVKMATVDLYASSLQTARVVWAGSFAAGSHWLQVRVTGTRNPSSSGTRIDVDAFIRWT